MCRFQENKVKQSYFYTVLPLPHALALSLAPVLVLPSTTTAATPPPHSITARSLFLFPVLPSPLFHPLPRHCNHHQWSLRLPNYTAIPASFLFLFPLSVLPSSLFRPRPRGGRHERHTRTASTHFLSCVSFCFLFPGTLTKSAAKTRENCILVKVTEFFSKRRKNCAF